MHNLIMKSSIFRTPFHPVRLVNFFDKIFFLELEHYDELEDEEEDKGKKGDEKNGNEGETVDETNPNYRLFGNASVEERDKKNKEQIIYMKENYGHIIRSKGFMWIAGMLFSSFGTTPFPWFMQYPKILDSCRFLLMW